VNDAVNDECVGLLIVMELFKAYRLRRRTAEGDAEDDEEEDDDEDDGSNGNEEEGEEREEADEVKTS
jgi:hypothetical protein